MTDGQRIVLAGAGDQEVGTFPITTLAPDSPLKRSLAFLLVMLFSY